jgi:hypothetical protein
LPYKQESRRYASPVLHIVTYSLGVLSVVEPPVPIPNTAVKRHSGDDTRGATLRENSSSPGEFVLQFQPLPIVLGRGFLRVPRRGWSESPDGGMVHGTERTEGHGKQEGTVAAVSSLREPLPFFACGLGHRYIPLDLGPASPLDFDRGLDYTTGKLCRCDVSG